MDPYYTRDDGRVRNPMSGEEGNAPARRKACKVPLQNQELPNNRQPGEHSKFFQALAGLGTKAAGVWQKNHGNQMLSASETLKSGHDFHMALPIWRSSADVAILADDLGL